MRPNSMYIYICACICCMNMSYPNVFTDAPKLYVCLYLCMYMLHVYGCAQTLCMFISVRVYGCMYMSYPNVFTDAPTATTSVS